MNIDLDLELPTCSDPDFLVPRLNADQYLKFIEFNQRVIRENGLFDQVLATRSQPVNEMFSLD